MGAVAGSPAAVAQAAREALGQQPEKDPDTVEGRDWLGGVLIAWTSPPVVRDATPEARCRFTRLVIPGDVLVRIGGEDLPGEVTRRDLLRRLAICGAVEFGDGVVIAAARRALDRQAERDFEAAEGRDWICGALIAWTSPPVVRAAKPEAQTDANALPLRLRRLVIAGDVLVKVGDEDVPREVSRRDMLLRITKRGALAFRRGGFDFAAVACEDPPRAPTPAPTLLTSRRLAVGRSAKTARTGPCRRPWSRDAFKEVARCGKGPSHLRSEPSAVGAETSRIAGEHGIDMGFFALAEEAVPRVQEKDRLRAELRAATEAAASHDAWAREQRRVEEQLRSGLRAATDAFRRLAQAVDKNAKTATETRASRATAQQGLDLAGAEEAVRRAKEVDHLRAELRAAAEAEACRAAAQQRLELALAREAGRRVEEVDQLRAELRAAASAEAFCSAEQQRREIEWAQDAVLRAEEVRLLRAELRAAAQAEAPYSATEQGVEPACIS